MKFKDYLIKQSNKYYDYIKSEQWKEKKRQILLARGEFCERCGEKNFLNVHHSSYKKLGNEPDEHLYILCRNCHEGFHQKYKMGESMINKTMNYIYGKGWRKRIKK